MSWLASFDNLAVNMLNLFRPTNTEKLPWIEKREHSSRYRASFALVHNEHGEEACIGCKMCEKICPSEIITVVPGGRKESPVTGKKRGYCDDFILDLNACIICELCVQVCPEDAILMLNVQEAPGYNREDLVLTMDKLYENEKLDATTWGTGTKLVDMQKPAPPPPKPEPEPVAAPSPAQETDGGTT
jgi:NADH-quinone oxidoreductase subunit I